MALFLILYFLVYGSMHLYFFQHFKGAVNPGLYLSAAAGIWMVFMIFAPVLTRISEKGGFFSTARALAWTGYSWLGFLFLMVVLLILLDIWSLAAQALGNNGFIRAAGPVWAKSNIYVVLTLCGLALWAYGFGEARSLKLERVRLETDKTVSSSGRLRVVQISDLHLGHMVGRGWLSQVVEAISREEPDLLVATGDVVDSLMENPSALAEIWRQVSPPLGKIAIMGNHEFYSGVQQAASFFQDSGFRVLRDKSIPVGAYLEVAGVDDPAGRRSDRRGDEPGKGTAQVGEENLFSNPDGRFRLLLKHQPKLGPGGPESFDLQLSGHLHKGQIFPFNLAVGLFYRMHSGLFGFPGGSHLYVSRGTGTWGPPIRIGSPPEITVIEIYGKPARRNETSPEQAAGYQPLRENMNS